MINNPMFSFVVSHDFPNRFSHHFRGGGAAATEAVAPPAFSGRSSRGAVAGRRIKPRGF